MSHANRPRSRPFAPANGLDLGQWSHHADLPVHFGRCGPSNRSACLDVVTSSFLGKFACVSPFEMYKLSVSFRRYGGRKFRERRTCSGHQLQGCSRLRASAHSTCYEDVLMTAVVTKDAVSLCWSASLRLASGRCSRYVVLAERRQRKSLEA